MEPEKISTTDQEATQELEATEKKQTVYNVLGFSIIWDKQSARKIILDADSKRIVVNPELFRTSDQAEFAATLMAMRQSESENILRTEKKENIQKILTASPQVMADVALFGATRRLSETEKQNIARVLVNLPLANSYVQEARNACIRFLADGSFGELSGDLKKLFDNLPISQSGRNPLDAIADGAVAIDRRLDYYQRYIEPILQAAQEADRQIEKTTGDSFQPSTEDSENEPLNEDQILQRVYPFFGGYYREKVFDDVDWSSMRMVATGFEAEAETGVDLAEDSEAKKYVFKGLDGEKLAMGPISLPLPASAIIVRDSLRPNDLVIKKDAKGIYFLTLNEIANQNNVVKEYSFEFIIGQETPDFLLAAPTQEESSFLANNNLFLPQKLSELEELAKLNISATAKAKRLVSLIHQGFEYINNTEIGLALAQAGQNYFRELENIKKADCDVANFYLVAQLRYLGIPARMVTGYYVSDSSFDFAPIAGTKHAWCEYFDASLGCWKRIDATPPKKEEEKEEQEKEKGSGGSGENMREQVEDGETNFEGEVEEEGLELTDEQYTQFQEYLQKKYEEIAGNEQEARKAMVESFLNEYGVSLEEWEKVMAYIEKVNNIKIAKENTIDGADDSTLGEEWQKFFDLFLVAYRLPDKSKRMFTRQSMGDDLVDPASTTIDLLAGSDDPYGFEKVRRGEREIKLPIDFSNDFLLDLTASMDTRDNFGHQLKEYQRQFVMSALYHGFEINQQLKYYAGELMELPFISNHLFSIHGNSLYRELTDGEREITMTQLSELFALLESTEQGAGNMVDALTAYRDALIARPDMVQKIQSGEMVKTLTVISDGNLWCSVCGKESCSYSLNTEGMAKSRRLVQELRKMGVIVNAIGFTKNSRPVADIFSDEDNPDAAIVVDNVEYAVAKHHKQMVKSWEVIKKAAQFRQLNTR